MEIPSEAPFDVRPFGAWSIGIVPFYKSVHCLGFQNAWEEATHTVGRVASRLGRLSSVGASSRSRRFGGQGSSWRVYQKTLAARRVAFPSLGKDPGACSERRPWPSGQEGWLRGRQPLYQSKNVHPQVSPLIDTCQHPVKLDVGIEGGS